MNILIEQSNITELGGIICDSLNIPYKKFADNDYYIELFGFCIGLTYDENSEHNDLIAPYIFSIEPKNQDLIEDKTVFELCKYFENILKMNKVKCFATEI